MPSAPAFVRKRSDDATLPPWIGVGALVGMLAVFGIVVGWVAFALREDIRDQLMSRDAHVLKLVLQHRIEQAEREFLIFEFEVLDERQLWNVVLDTAAAEGVLAAQLFSDEGKLLETTSDALLLQELPATPQASVDAGRAYASFQPEASLSEFIRLDYREDSEVAVLNLYIPLRSENGDLLGTSRFIMDGSLLADEFALLDRRLTRQAAAAVGSGGVLLVGLFWLAWRRLEAARRELHERAERLRRSNAELAMLARTSAVGSVAAHLIHGLKNPLAGLRQVVSSRDSGADALAGEDWESAKEAANRMQSMVQEVIALLQDSAATESNYELDLADLRDEILRRFEEPARKREVAFEVEIIGTASLDSHRANIVLLIISNLVQNALEAVSNAGAARVDLAADGTNLVATVSDDGPGIKASAREELFRPIVSGKEGGAGIGLAISKQLARHIGGTLRCLPVEGAGARFELDLPLGTSSQETELVD